MFPPRQFLHLSEITRCSFVILAFFLLCCIGACIADSNEQLSETVSLSTNSSSIVWTDIDEHYYQPCNVTTQCGHLLVCVNSSCQACTGKEPCNDDPYVVCTTTKTVVRVRNESLGNDTFGSMELELGLCKTKALFPPSVWDLLATFFSSFGGIGAAGKLFLYLIGLYW